MATRRKPIAERRDRQAFEERRLHAAELFAKTSTRPRSPVPSASPARPSAAGTSAGRPTAPPACAAVAHRAAPPTVGCATRAGRAGLLEGAKAHGFDTDLWTLDRIAEVIWRITGVRHHPAQVWRLLCHRLDWSLQRPARRAQARDEQAIRQWVARDWPRIKKTPGAARPSSASSTSPGSR
jgi:hypothetical protein